jgi:hypothetical protein
MVTKKNKLPEVLVELQTPDDRPLLAKAGQTMNPATKTVYARPLGRFGYTGSHLFVAHFTSDRGGIPHVVKINDKPRIDDEAKALGLMQTFFEDAKPTRTVNRGGSARAAIVYPLIQSGQGTDVVELKDLVYAKLTGVNHEKQLLKRLDDLYGGCCERAHQGTRRSFKLGKQYRPYARGNTHTQRHLTVILGEPTRRGPFSFLGAEIVDPRAVLDSVRGRSIRGMLADAVHGDLHPSNVLIDQERKPRLIDFAWGHQRAHVLKDFVLLECSLRFLHFPKYAHLDTQLSVDQALLAEDGPAKLAALTQNDPLAVHYKRLGALLERLRLIARERSGRGYGFSEYLHAQYCVLYGLLGYETYSFPFAARALGLLAHEIA